LIEGEGGALSVENFSGETDLAERVWDLGGRFSKSSSRERVPFPTIELNPDTEVVLVLKGADLAGLYVEGYEGEAGSDSLENVSRAFWKVLSKVLDRCARGNCRTAGVGSGSATTLFNFSTMEAGLGLELGSRMRLTIPEDKPEDDRGSGETTLTPVVLGERGDVIIVAGSVCRFELEGVNVDDRSSCADPKEGRSANVEASGPLSWKDLFAGL